MDLEDLWKTVMDEERGKIDSGKVQKKKDEYIKYEIRFGITFGWPPFLISSIHMQCVVS